MTKKKSSPKEGGGLLKGKMKPIRMKPPSKKQRELTLQVLLRIQRTVQGWCGIGTWNEVEEAELNKLLELARLAVKGAQSDD